MKRPDYGTPTPGKCAVIGLLERRRGYTSLWLQTDREELSVDEDGCELFHGRRQKKQHCCFLTIRHVFFSPQVAAVCLFAMKLSSMTPCGRSINYITTYM